MKHSAALKVKVGDVVALNRNKDGVLWGVLSVHFPLFTVEECGLYACKLNKVDYVCLHKPTKAQVNAYNKRQEKYYESGTDTRTN